MLAASILGSGLAFIDGSVVNVALPAIGHGLRADPAMLSWAISAYLLPLGALILLGGGLGDHYGRRRLFLVGIGIFLAASLGCAAAQGIVSLLAARFVQGVGAAMLMPNSLAMLGATFQGEARGRAIGTWAGTGALLAAVGPVLGGVLVDAVGWRTIFLINLPVGLAAMALARAGAPDPRHPDPTPLDRAGAALITLALALLTASLTEAARPHPPGALIAGLLGGGLVLLAAFLRLEIKRGRDALMPFYLMTGRSFAGVTLLTLLLYAALGGLLVLLPYRLIHADGYSAIEAGASLLPVSVLIGLASRPMGRVAARIGGRLPLGTGSITVGLGLALYALLATPGAGYARSVLPPTLLVAIGMALSVAPLTTTVLNSVDAAHVGAASGFNSAVARIGGLIATALLSFVFVDQGSADGFLAGFRAAAGVGAALALSAGMAAFVLIEGKKSSFSEEKEAKRL